MLRDGTVTVELHVEPVVSRWRALVPGAPVLRRAMYRPTSRGVLLLADDTDTFVHMVAHEQLQDETHRLLGLPLRALFEQGLSLVAVRASTRASRATDAFYLTTLDGHKLVDPEAQRRVEDAVLRAIGQAPE